MTHRDRKSSPFLREISPVEEEINNPPDYYLTARASREVGKATFDLLFDEEYFDFGDGSG